MKSLVRAEIAARSAKHLVRFRVMSNPVQSSSLWNEVVASVISAAFSPDKNTQHQFWQVDLKLCTFLGPFSTGAY